MVVLRETECDGRSASPRRFGLALYRARRAAARDAAAGDAAAGDAAAHGRNALPFAANGQTVLH
ncbi:hypothetical protein ABTM49_20235, partial [Acinetobacter baumannii]